MLVWIIIIFSDVVLEDFLGLEDNFSSPCSPRFLTSCLLKNIFWRNLRLKIVITFAQSNNYFRWKRLFSNDVMITSKSRPWSLVSALSVLGLEWCCRRQVCPWTQKSLMSLALKVVFSTSRLNHWFISFI